MKKIVFLGFLIFLVSIGIGFCFGRVMISNSNTENYQSNVNKIIVSNQIISEEAVSTELKVKPNIEFGIKEFFDECGHFKFEYTELPNELVNMTKQEIEEHYNGTYEVEQFDEKTLILTREINGICDNHYVIKLNENDLIDVYKVNTDTSYNLYQSTEISEEFLPASDVEKLKEGIMVYGIGKVNSILEDYE